MHVNAYFKHEVDFIVLDSSFESAVLSKGKKLCFLITGNSRFKCCEYRLRKKSSVDQLEMLLKERTHVLTSIAPAVMHDRIDLLVV